MDETETLGSYLKNQRESKKISLKEVAKNTRVREHILKAIEEDRHDLLPPHTYVKGFLSAYAKYLRLDENEILLRYERILKGGPVAPPSAEPSPKKEKTVEPPESKKKIFPPPSSEPQEEMIAASPSEPKKKRERNTRPIWIIAVVIAAGLAAVYFFSPYPSKSPESLPEKPVAEKTPLEEKATTPIPPVPAVTSAPEEKPIIKEKEPVTPSSPVASTTSAPESKPISLQLKAVEETWISLEVDDQPGKTMTLKTGETFSAQATNRIRMLLGNAGGLEMTWNGKKLEPFGKSGEVVKLLFTSKEVEVKRLEKTNPPKE